jgi:CDP-diacylglycerol--inositol 3-phosphatidyltransferase
LDFASHYMHMYATLSMGGQGESHKNVSASRSRIMNLYYTNKVHSFQNPDIRPTNSLSRVCSS